MQSKAGTVQSSQAMKFSHRIKDNRVRSHLLFMYQPRCELVLYNRVIKSEPCFTTTV